MLFFLVFQSHAVTVLGSASVMFLLPLKCRHCLREKEFKCLLYMSACRPQTSPLPENHLPKCVLHKR